MKGLLIKEFYTKKDIIQEYIISIFILLIILPIMRLLLPYRASSNEYTTTMSFLLTMSLAFQNVNIAGDIDKEFYKLANILPLPKYYIGKSKYILTFSLIAIISVSYIIVATLMNILFDYPVWYSHIYFDVTFILCVGNINFAITINSKHLGKCSDKVATMIVSISMVTMLFI